MSKEQADMASDKAHAFSEKNDALGMKDAGYTAGHEQAAKLHLTAANQHLKLGDYATAGSHAQYAAEHVDFGDDNHPIRKTALSLMNHCRSKSPAVDPPNTGKSMITLNRMDDVMKGRGSHRKAGSSEVKWSQKGDTHYGKFAPRGNKDQRETRGTKNAGPSYIGQYEVNKHPETGKYHWKRVSTFGVHARSPEGFNSVDEAKADVHRQHKNEMATGDIDKWTPKTQAASWSQSKERTKESSERHEAHYNKQEESRHLKRVRSEQGWKDEKAASIRFNRMDDVMKSDDGWTTRPGWQKGQTDHVHKDGYRVIDEQSEGWDQPHGRVVSVPKNNGRMEEFRWGRANGRANGREEAHKDRASAMAAAKKHAAGG